MTISRAGARLMTHRLFCGCSLFDRRCFDLGLLALLIGVVQQPIDDARTLLLLDPSVLRLLLFSEEFVVYFPTHWVLHRRRNQRHTNAHIIAYGYREQRTKRCPPEDLRFPTRTVQKPQALITQAPN